MDNKKISLVEKNDNKTFRDERGLLNKIISSDLMLIGDKQIPIVEVIVTTNTQKGTIRGLHYDEISLNSYKIVSCISGEIVQYFVDMRKNSDSYLKSATITTHEDELISYKIPPGIAYGYQTLCKNTRILYGITSAYNPQFYKGINIFDSIFKFDFPIKKYVISNKDKSLPFIGDKK